MKQAKTATAARTKTTAKCSHCAARDAAIDWAIKRLSVPVHHSIVYEITVREYEAKINRVIDMLLVAKSKEVE